MFAWVNAVKSLVALGFIAVLLAGCGGAPRPVVHGVVQVFSCTTVSMRDCKADATKAEELAIGRRLRRTPHVVKVVYTSKAAGLARLKRSNPLFKHLFPLFVNPLPDKWVVTVDSEENTKTVGEAICAARYPGVEPCQRESGGVHWGGVHWGTRLPRLR